ncbi:hypothetical protein V7x_22740 [Crateriforma conspicua]|uniref:Uncharacterized protein n=1 Tax=Crateriforma conspicua TaxID=2527996 RepID=A0A5C6G0C7_9PLAN|nr:hypothetical protein V7x_22740 [Crateriforma conspicua]
MKRIIFSVSLLVSVFGLTIDLAGGPCVKKCVESATAAISGSDSNGDGLYVANQCREFRSAISLWALTTSGADSFQQGESVVIDYDYGPHGECSPVCSGLNRNAMSFFLVEATVDGYGVVHDGSMSWSWECPDESEE